MVENNNRSAFIDNIQLLGRLKKCTTLPTPPGVAVQIINLGQDPMTDLGAVADVVSVDPALSVKILRIANSSLYARRRKTENLRQAIMMFGVNGTLNIALSVSLVTSLRSNKKSDLDYNLFWRRSVAAATCCKFLATALKLKKVEEYFLAGLVQDIGILALDKAMPDLYQNLGSCQNTHDELCDFEIAQLEADHAAVGAWLLKNWNLSTRLLVAVAGSHDPESVEIDDQDWSFVCCVALSSVMADIWCKDDNDDSIENAFQRGVKWLNIDRNLFLEIIDNANGQIREMFSLFEVDLDDWSQLECIQEQAKEILTLITLKNMQEADGLRKTIANLESRTQELEENTRRDALTGLYNRDYLDYALGREFQTAKTHGWPLSVAFIDLDTFKQINDNYGHQSGDKVLQKAAELFQENTRDTDIVSRYGGEEFVVVLAGTGIEGARITCERLVTAFQNTHHDVGQNKQLVVTISIGLATEGETVKFETPQTLLKAADFSVYKAKAMGRNRFIEFNAVD